VIRRSLFVAAIVAFLAGCARRSSSGSGSNGVHMMSGRSDNVMMRGGLMNVSQRDMSTYMEMFDHHLEIRRNVEQLTNGIRTTTVSYNPRIVGLLHEHVPSMYQHVSDGQEVRCMSDSLPTMFREAQKYKRQVALIPTGVLVVETSDDPVVLAALRRHADEVSGFVRDGMPAMMRGMMR